jgi:hypothetical protein
MAGGPYGGWYYFGPSNMGMMVRLPPSFLVGWLTYLRLVAQEPGTIGIRTRLDSVARFDCIRVVDRDAAGAATDYPECGSGERC